MKILHIGNTAGIGTSLREFERNQGHDSDVLITKERLNPFRYPYKFLIPIDGKNLHSFKNLAPYIRLALRYDVIHYHYRPVTCCADMLFLLLCGKKIYLHYHGSDIRGKKQPLMHKLCASRTFVSTPDLLEYAPGAECLPNPIIETDIPHEARREYLESRQPGDPMRILHTPTNPEIKGTKYIQTAIARLREEGHNIEYIQPTRCSHKENLLCMAQCDLYIDQLSIGFYGVSALECACMGVPAVCFVSPQFESPFINADKNSIYSVLKDAIKHPDTLQGTVKNELEFYEARKEAINEILRPGNLHKKRDPGLCEAVEMP